MSTDTATMTTFITPDALLEHWQGHRRLTRRIIEAFPEDKLFAFQPALPMRSFGCWRRSCHIGSPHSCSEPD